MCRELEGGNFHFLSQHLYCNLQSAQVTLGYVTSGRGKLSYITLVIPDRLLEVPNLAIESNRSLKFKVPYLRRPRG